jgi:hypothetical protein
MRQLACRFSFFLFPFSFFLSCCLPVPAQAAKVKVWHHHSPAQFEKARFTNAVVTSEGALRLARRLRPLATLRATHVWAVVQDRAGDLLVATGDEGKVFKVTPEGHVSVAFACEDSQVLCLTMGPDGAVYAGTGPGGLVLRINSDGGGEVLYRTPEAYVWSLAVAADGQALYAGTGPKGRIYEITPHGKGRVFYATKQEHILALAAGPDGLLYAGTDKDGLVYRIDRHGKGFVLTSTPQSEVRSLLVTDEGVYAGTSTPTRRRGAASQTARSGAAPGASPSLSDSGNRTRPSAGDGASTGGRALAAGLPSASASGTCESSERGAAGVPPPGSGENSLYRIATDGTVRELFRDKTMLLSLLRQGGRILIGTGMDGQLFEVEEKTKERSEVARLDHGQIHCLCARRDGSVVLGTGDPGKLYVLEDRHAETGTVVSEVLDAKLLSKWGALRWKADQPDGTRLSVAVRSGNTSEPNDTWSDWSAEQTDPRNAVIAAPPARFLQYRVTLATDDPGVTPAASDLALRYRTANQAPEVTAVQVPDLDAVNLDDPKKLRLKWSALDPNEDELTYSLYLRKDGWGHWVRLEEGCEKTEYEWDTTTTPEGIYRLKVVANDRKDNPAEECLTGERISKPFAVVHTPPAVTLKASGRDGDRVVLSASATAALVRLTTASYSINGKKWVNVFPSDGLFDSKEETFRFTTEPLRPGTYVVVLRVRDAAGNTGSGDVVFTIPARGE